MANVVIPALLRKFTDGKESIEVPGRTVRELIEAIEQQYPGFRGHLVEGGEIRPSIAVSIDGVVGIAGIRERVNDDSEVHFIPAIGGGA